jgi:hypothetical protein
MALGGDVKKTPHEDGPRALPQSHESLDAKPPESARLPKREVARRAFSAKRRRAIAGIVEAFLADEGEQGLIAPRAELVHRVTDELDLWIGAGSPDLGRGYRVLSWLIEWLPLLIVGTLTRSSRLPLARRLGYLVRLERARFPLLSALVVGFKVPITMLAFELDPELRRTGFDRATVSTPRTLQRQLKVHAG